MRYSNDILRFGCPAVMMFHLLRLRVKLFQGFQESMVILAAYKGIKARAKLFVRILYGWFKKMVNKENGIGRVCYVRNNKQTFQKSEQLVFLQLNERFAKNNFLQKKNQKFKMQEEMRHQKNQRL